MRNKYALFFLIASVVSAHAELTPVILNIPAGGQADVRISNSNPNYFEVPGDYITGITSAPGMLTDKRNTAAGGAFLSTTQSHAFTLYLSTEGGQTFSLNALPVKVPGRSYLLASHKPVAREEAKTWETSQPYESLLIELNRAVHRGHIPQGYVKAAYGDSRIRSPAGVRVSLSGAWEGHKLRILRWQVANTGTMPITLREQDFWQPGVRAVMFSTPKRELTGGSNVSMFVTSTREESNGER